MTTLDATEYRRVVGTFATGVCVITTGSDNGTHAITVNSLTSVSLDPMLLLVCLDRSSRALPVLDESGAFNVNVLGQHQEDVSRTFASKTHDHAVSADCAIGLTGAPLLPDCLAYMHCRIVQRFEAGDHIILLAAVEHAELGAEAPPLVFYRGSYSALAEAPIR
jgi:flavin reductase (DIM6/NTAB) family NADH-FMN oxidoreductase RutF